MNVTRTLWLALLLVLAGCAVEEPPSLGARRQAAGSGDGSQDLPAADLPAADLPEAGGSAPASCGLVPEQGCCQDQLLVWCEQGVLKTIDCSDAPKCGWSDAQFYDCNTSGAADPTGQTSLHCHGLLPDGGLALDGGRDAGVDDCGGIGREGCCDNATLRYCEDGQLREVSCALNPSCGWLGIAQYYDCGTDGMQDPSGTFPRLCPGSVPWDASPDLLPTVDAASVADAAEEGGGGGDGCAVGAGPPRPPLGAAWGLLLAGLALVGLRRRR